MHSNVLLTAKEIITTSLSAVAVIVKALQFLAKWSSVLGSTPAQEKLVKQRPLDCGCRFKCDPYWICTTWVSILKKIFKK